LMMFNSMSRVSLEARHLVFILSSNSRVSDKSRELVDAVQFKMT
jgi:hypothetical protein